MNSTGNEGVDLRELTCNELRAQIFARLQRLVRKGKFEDAEKQLQVSIESSLMTQPDSKVVVGTLIIQLFRPMKDEESV